MSDALLSVEDLEVTFETDDGPLRAVSGASFSVDRGETLGIVGESGSGKSVANLTVLGLTRAPNTAISGRIMFDGRDLATLPAEELRRVRGNDIGMIFQDPLTSLHPFYKIGRQLAEAINAHRDVSDNEARERTPGGGHWSRGRLFQGEVRRPGDDGAPQIERGEEPSTQRL